MAFFIPIALGASLLIGLVVNNQKEKQEARQRQRQRERQRERQRQRRRKRQIEEAKQEAQRLQRQNRNLQQKRRQAQAEKLRIQVQRNRIQRKRRQEQIQIKRLQQQSQRVQRQRYRYQQRMETQRKYRQQQIYLVKSNASKVQTKIQQYNNQLQRQKAKALKTHNSKQYKQHRQQLFVSFLDNIRTYTFTQKINKQIGKKYHMVMGLISAGKSSLLNSILGVKLKVGRGETTSQAKVVGQYKYGYKTTQILDSPGVNEDFSFYDIETLSLLCSVDKIFICYKDSLSVPQIGQLLRIIKTIKKGQRLTLIRTHCDLFTQPDQLSCQEQIQVDKSYAKKKLDLDCQIYAFSAKKGSYFKDNSKVQKLIKGIN